MAIKKATIDIILDKWDKFKEKHQSGINKKNKEVNYNWSNCSCEKQRDNEMIHFIDKITVNCSMKAEDKLGAFYDHMNYILTIYLNTVNWSYNITFERIPDNKYYFEYECLKQYTGNGYFELIQAFDELESKLNYKIKETNKISIPYYMSGFSKFYDILINIPDTHKRCEGQIFPLEYIQSQIVKVLNENTKYNQSCMTVKWDNFAGLYGVYDLAYTEATWKSGKVNSCYADCYVGYCLETGYWRVERNIGKSTFVKREDYDIDMFIKYVNTFVKYSVCIDEFVQKIKFFKQDLLKIQREDEE